jgi:hypothetical protein
MDFAALEARIVALYATNANKPPGGVYLVGLAAGGVIRTASGNARQRRRQVRIWRRQGFTVTHWSKA